jgi:hypothetical protein
MTKLAKYANSYNLPSKEESDEGIMALLDMMSDDHQKQSQFNTVFYQNDKNGPGRI